MGNPDKRFRIALSFPGEHRDFVERVAAILAERVGRERVLYDRYLEDELARPNLDTYLLTLYGDDSELIVAFLSKEYEGKEWCGLEWRVIRDLVKRRQDNSIMLLRLDDSEIPGLLSIDGYMSIDDRSSEDVAAQILQRMGMPEDDPQVSRRPPRWKLLSSIGAIALVLLAVTMVSLVLSGKRGLARTNLYQNSPLVTAELQSQVVGGVFEVTGFKNPLPAWKPLRVSTTSSPRGTSRAIVKDVRLPPAYDPAVFNDTPTRCDPSPGLSWGHPNHQGPPLPQSGTAQVAIDPLEPDSNYRFCVTFERTSTPDELHRFHLRVRQEVDALLTDGQRTSMTRDTQGLCGRLRVLLLEITATDEVLPPSAMRTCEGRAVQVLEEGMQRVQEADGATRDDAVNAVVTEVEILAKTAVLADSTSIVASTASYETPWQKWVRLPLSAGIAAFLINGMFMLGIPLVGRTADRPLWRFRSKRALIGGFGTASCVAVLSVLFPVSVRALIHSNAELPWGLAVGTAGGLVLGLLTLRRLGV